jgi:uncharacterized membrane protein
MERVELLIYIVILIFAVFLVVKYWQTGKKD